MRKQILGTTAAILSAGALTIGLPTAPTHGAAWKTMTAIPFPAGSISDVEVVSTGDGDAVAAAIINGAVYASTATNGLWGSWAQVRGGVNATGLALAANQAGDVAAGWNEDVSGDVRFRVSRQTNPSTWTGLQLLTPAGTDVVGTAELGVAGNGRVIVAASVDEGDQDNKLLVTEWPEGGTPTNPQELSPADAWSPSLDVNKKGEAVLAWNYTGIAQDVLTVSHRTAGGTWSLGASTGNDGNIAANPEVAISDNGEGQVIYAVVKNGFYVAETSRVLPSGAVLPAQTASPLNEYVYETDVDINATGSALFTWVTKKDGLASVRYASAANASYPGTSSSLPGASIDVSKPTARISDSGLRVIQYESAGYVTTQYRTSNVQPFVATNTTNGFAHDHAVDVDDAGNAVLVAFKPGGSVYGRFLDATGPIVTPQVLQANTLNTIIPVKWTMSDSLSAIPNTDVYATTAAWNQATATDPAIIANDVEGTEAPITATPGTTYCIQLRPTDTAGNSTTTAKQCTTVPLDDRALIGEGWNEPNETGNFRNTLTTTTKQGRVLTRTGVKAKRLALVVRKTDNSGSVRVTFDGDVLGTYSLQGTGKKKVISLGSFPTVRSGTLTIKVTSPDGKYVGIDGLIVAK
jgi:hypothetical protein